MKIFYKSLTIISFVCCVLGFLLAIISRFILSFFHISVSDSLGISFALGFGGLILMMVFSSLGGKKKNKMNLKTEDKFKQFTLGIKGLITEKHTFQGVEKDNPVFTGIIKNILATQNVLRDETFVVFTVLIKEWDRNVEISQFIDLKLAPVVGETVKIIGYRDDKKGVSM